MQVWNPYQCALQLVFSRPAGTSAAPIRTGSTYQGTSVVRYRRELLDADASSSAVKPSAVTSSSEHEDFLQHRREVAAKNALHLHALTTAGGLYKDAKPLQVSSFQVHCVAVGSGGAGKTGPRKVLSVEQQDAMCVAATASSAKVASNAKTAAGKQKGRAKASTSKKAATDESSATVDASSSCDWGSKLVHFEDAENLPLYSEVELTVQFTGTVQSFDHGGIYAARVEPEESSGDAPLLTHLEVRFARCAFPCPDDPQCRLEWQVKSLQLPDTYQAVLSNGEAQGRKDMPAQRAVQYGFAPCGPLPAYVFSFACFPETLEQAETVLRVPVVAGDAMEDSTGTSASHTIPLRVLARRPARIPLSTLEKVLHTTAEAVASLQQVFRCPLPLLQCRHLDVLLGPTMPYISGMEHHCSIILNETIYQPSKKASASGSAAVEQTELIVHELAHHWVGNALGLPFAVKEGICQVLEQCIGDTLLGKPMRKFKPDSVSEVSNAASAAAETTTAPARTDNTIQASEKGREFTGTSYQLALSAIRRRVAESGFDAFERCLQQLLHEYVVVPTLAAEEQGGAQVLRCIGAEVPPPPYLSTETFLQVMEETS